MHTFNRIVLIILFLNGIQHINAQIENDVEVSDSVPGNIEQEKFEQLLFKAISQRGIENYEKAIQTLTELEKDTKDEPVIYFQLGLNYYDLEDFNLALINLERANELKPNDFDIEEAIFKVYYKQNKYQSAIDKALALVGNDKQYFEVVANLYLQLQNFEKALFYLDMSDQALGFSPNKDNMRQSIYKLSANNKKAITYYERREQEQPYNPYNMYRLAFYQLKDNQYDNALISLDRLKTEHPTFSRAYVLETDVYVQYDMPEKALVSLKTVVNDRLLEEKYKIEAIEIFKAYLNTHPEYQQQFIDVLNDATQTAEENASYLDLAEFYFETDKPRSLENYYKALEQNPQNYKILSAISVLNFQLENYDKALAITDQALEVFPSQVIFMLYKGKSLLGLEQYEQATSVLSDALDYMFEENAMMLELYQSLSAAYQSLGDNAKAVDYKNKADKLKSQLE